MKEKFCYCCKNVKDITLFKKNKKRKYKNFCKECYINFDRKERDDNMYGFILSVVRSQYNKNEEEKCY